jgi:hypothetical protein
MRRRLEPGMWGTRRVKPVALRVIYLKHDKNTDQCENLCELGIVKKSERVFGQEDLKHGTYLTV